MNELTTTRTPEIVAAEIRTFTASMLNNIIEIGRRMVEVKEMLPHGEFMGWVEETTGYSQSTANNFMRLFAEYGDRQGSLFGAEVNSQTFANLTYSKALALLALPSGEREEFVESHDVSDMTTKELKEAIRERDEARKALQTTEARLADTKRTLTESSNLNTELQQKLAQARADVKAADDEAAENERQLKERIKELESAPKEVYKDEAAIQKAADEARAAAEAEWSAKVKEAEDKLAKAREKAEKAEEKAKKAGEQTNGEVANLKAEAEQLRAELERAKREQAMASISGDADLAAFQLLFEAAQTDINKMRGLLLKVRGRENSELGAKLTAALLALAEKVKECAA